MGSIHTDNSHKSRINIPDMEHIEILAQPYICRHLRLERTPYLPSALWKELRTTVI